MHRFKKMALLLIAVFLLPGCSMASQVEDQAYVLVMGLDRLRDGQVEMTVQIPKITAGASENGGGQGNYMQMSITSASFEAALEKLEWALPRNMNLAQMKLIVISRNLASETACKELIANIAQTERLFTATKIAVCEGSAKEFVLAVQPYAGARISTDIEAMFDHYNDCGYVPESSLADLYYQTESVYSDPMVSYAVLNSAALKKQEENKSVPASVFLEGMKSASDSCESEIPTRYLGAALFSNGCMKGILNGGQTVIANLLRNELDSFRYENNGQNLEFVPTRPVYLHVDTKANPIKVHANIRLSYAAQEKIPNEAVLERQLKNDIMQTILYTQELGVEPFGFAERAARKFLTLEDWINFDWKKQYSQAEIEINLHFAQSDA